jgi:hypothetical protein
VRLESEASAAYKHRLKADLLDNQRGEHIVSPEADWGCFGTAGALHYSTVERSAPVCQQAHIGSADPDGYGHLARCEWNKFELPKLSLRELLASAKLLG